MSELDPLVESYLDLVSEEIVPLSAASGAGANDPVWLQARMAALRSIAHAAEDLEFGSLQDEVDRTMLIDTIRLDLHEIKTTLKPSTPEAVVEGRLAALTAEPTGIRGTLRILELRRAGVWRGLESAANDLGMDDPMATIRSLREEVEENWSGADGWDDEWRRTGEVLASLGLPVVAGDAPPLPEGERDEWSYTVLAVRGHAILMLEASRAAQSRLVRKRLVAPGHLAGWGRVVAALLRETELFALPERRLMLSYRGLRDTLAAEVDLQLQAGMSTAAELLPWVTERMGGAEAEAREIVEHARRTPYLALSAALAYEGWQNWYAEDGGAGDAPGFLRRALQGGGLAVRLARWAAASPEPV